jgi:hypothetical protein
MICSSFFSMNSMYEKDKSYILINTRKHSKQCKFSISGIKMMPNYQENVSKNQNAHAKLSFFPNINQNEYPKEYKTFICLIIYARIYENFFTS